MSNPATIRHHLAAVLAEYLPGYRIVPHIDAIDRVTKPLIYLEQTRLEPAPYQGAALVTINLAVVTPLVGVTAQSENDIDARGVEVFRVLNSISWIQVEAGEKNIFQDKYLSYVIETKLITEGL